MRKLCSGVLGLGIFSAACLFAQPSTNYSIAFPNAVHHEAEISATFTEVVQPNLEIVMSRSSPGRYALAEFAKNIYHVHASDGAGHSLAVTHPNPYSWQVSGHRGTVVFEYTLFGDHADGTYAGIDLTHAHLNMPAAFAWAKGYQEKTSTFRFKTPPGSKWKIATQLLPDDDGSFHAPDLEWMMDSPVELSDHTLIEWKVEDAKFRLALHHRGTKKEAQQYAKMCQAIVLEEEGVMGALPKYDGGTYTFLADFLPYVFGDGMEHRDSTVMTSTQTLASAAKRLAGTASHEFFHSWNVRRMRPRSLEPFDFEHVDMSGELWFAEGFTNYYGLLTLERAGITNLDDFVRSMGSGVNAVLTSPGRNVHSAVGMSELAPFVDAAVSVDKTNFTNTFISYYTYGQALAFGLDLAIRDRFPGKSLDDYMRTVWRQHPDIERPYDLAGLEVALADTTGDKAFAASFFRSYIDGRQALDYAALVKPAGLLVQKAHPGKVWLGLVSARGSSASLKSAASGLEIEGEPRVGSPFYNAGLGGGDIIFSVDGKSGEGLEDLLKKHHPGDRVPTQAHTRTGDKKIELTMTEDPTLELITAEAAGQKTTPEIEAFRKQWLSSKSLHPLPKLKGISRTDE